MTDVLALHGANLNKLGMREPEIYGSSTLAEIDAALRREASRLAVSIACMQFNDEGGLIAAIHDARRTARSILINAAAHTHVSFALRDALAMFEGPKVEVHLSKNPRREPFRRVSTISPVCDGSIVGFGVDSYLLGLEALSRLLGETVAERPAGRAGR